MTWFGTRARRAALLLGALVVGCGPACGAPSGGPGKTASTAAPDPDEALRARLRKALADKGPDYVPRTRHVNADGSPKYVNRLILESSPYLLQHAHNPVDWHTWGDEAFAKARATGRPVFLSIGYSTCHWCHVMEEESFEDEEIARFLNDHFVAIKVDRDERPDIDAVYMTAVMSFTGSGGWPMSVWLTPDREPFFAGTYFPPRDGARGARHGLLSVLRELSQDYEKDPSAAARDAKRFADRVKKLAAVDPPGDMPGPRVLLRAIEDAAASFDADNGGRKGAPKFPSSFPTRLFLRHARRAGDAATLRMAATTLSAMQAGGIHDHVGGGFHRYATDRAWRVPHFEKMLYDNALLATAYLEGAQSKGDASFLATARETLDYLLREMRSPEGTFRSATDADSLAPSGKREEGYFFTWTPAEVRSALDGDAETAALAYFGVTATGHVDGRSTLATPRLAGDVAKELGWDEARFDSAVSAAKTGLHAARSKRPPPLRDDKVLVGWNALVVSALVRAAIVLGDKTYSDAAQKAISVLVRDVQAGGELPHVIRAPKAPGGPAPASTGDGRGGDSPPAGGDRPPANVGFLDDHTALANALLDVFELTSDPAYLDLAATLMERVEKRFADRANGGYFLTPDGAEALLVRDKPSDDGPTPNGSSLAALAWERLALIKDDPRFSARAETTFRAFAAPLGSRPVSLDAMLAALDFATDAPKEIVIALPDGADRGALSASARPLLSVLRTTFVPNAALVVAPASDLAGPLGQAVPWARDKVAKSGKATAYVCIRGTCKMPVTDPADLARELAEAKPY